MWSMMIYLQIDPNLDFVNALGLLTTPWYCWNLRMTNSVCSAPPSLRPLILRFVHVSDINFSLRQIIMHLWRVVSGSLTATSTLLLDPIILLALIKCLIHIISHGTVSLNNHFILPASNKRICLPAHLQQKRHWL